MDHHIFAHLQGKLQLFMNDSIQNLAAYWYQIAAYWHFMAVPRWAGIALPSYYYSPLLNVDFYECPSIATGV